ncbi:MAG TPA: stage II sporulation protein M, partial [Bacteroidia bacterium]|nr:stage II sporulation protein M [Bacteroidia bacterium]
MREVTFVSQNIDKWKTFENFLTNKDNHNPDEISNLYVQVIDDLSYARTFYPTSPTAIYLNQLTGKAHQTIYKNKKEKGSRI